jgi:hypothetical protein
MQGLGHNDDGVLILGATNLPWALDPASEGDLRGGSISLSLIMKLD